MYCSVTVAGMRSQDVPRYCCAARSTPARISWGAASQSARSWMVGYGCHRAAGTNAAARASRSVRRSAGCWAPVPLRDQPPPRGGGMLQGSRNASSQHVHKPVMSRPDFDDGRVSRLSRAADPGGLAEWCPTLRHAIERGAGQARRGGGVRRYGHLEGKLPVPDLPRGGDRPVQRVQAGANVCETAARLRPDEDVLVAGVLRIDLDSRDRVVQPRAHGAVRVVVERVHPWILEGRVRLLAVPSLPDRRRALLDRVEPGRVLVAQQQGVGVVEIAARAEDGIQVGRSQEARGQVLEAAHVLHQAPGGILARLLRHKVEREGQRVRRLRVRGETAACSEVLSVERRSDLPKELAVLPGVLRFAQYLRGAGQQARRVGEEGGRDEVLIGGRSRIVGARRVEREPVAEVEARVQDQVVPGQPPHVFRSEEHTSELQSRLHLVCRLLLEKKKNNNKYKEDSETDANEA